MRDGGVAAGQRDEQRRRTGANRHRAVVGDVESAVAGFGDQGPYRLQSLSDLVGAIACGGGGEDQGARCIVAGGGDGSGVVLGGVGGGAGPEFATAADFVRHGVDVCRETSRGLIPFICEPTQRIRPPRFGLRDGRPCHLAPNR